MCVCAFAHMYTSYRYEHPVSLTVGWLFGLTASLHMFGICHLLRLMAIVTSIGYGHGEVFVAQGHRFEICHVLPQSVYT